MASWCHFFSAPWLPARERQCRRLDADLEIRRRVDNIAPDGRYCPLAYIVTESKSLFHHSIKIALQDDGEYGETHEFCERGFIATLHAAKRVP